MKKINKLTKKQEKLIINSIIYQMIASFDITALDNSNLIDEDTKIELSKKVRLVAKKFETDFINIGDVNNLLKTILSQR
jgi:hypothetical protein